ncbi:MAG: hypothetical protein K0R57_405 [Paenibacillaceae bacterium]|jgi:AraC-like DNA-binding protein|nr:hypothetical protein [Paenibacillaceae bacterium]
MKFKQHLFSRAYYAKMVLLTSAAIMLTVVVLTSIVFLNAQNIMIKKEYASNSKILLQVRNNINLMNQMINNLCRYLYLSGDVGAVMYAREENMADIATRLNKTVSAVASANPFFHSITIYNRNLDQFYSAGASLAGQDRMLHDFVNNQGVLPRLKPVFRDMERLVNGIEEKEQLFSYFFYENSIATPQPDGIVAINIKLAWLLDNISEINRTGNPEQNRVFMLDASGRFWEDAASPPENNEWLKNAYNRYKSGPSYKGSNGYFRERQDGTDYLVTYAEVEQADVTLLQSQPLAEVYRDISRLRLSVLLIAGTVLVVALGLSLGISKNLYRPINKLIHTIAADGSRRFASTGAANEMDYLNHVYKQSMEKLDFYDKERYQYKDVMKHYWLNRLLFEDLVMKPDELEALFRQMRIDLPVGEEYALLYLRVDRYKEFRKRFTGNGSETIRFALLNIASEIIGRSWRNEGLDLKGDHVVLIIAVSPDKEEQWRRIEQDIAEIRDFFTNAFHVSFTASLSGRTNNWSSLQQLYKQASEQAGQRFLMGHGKTILPVSDQKPAIAPKESYSKLWETRLAESINARLPLAAEEALKSLFREIEALDYPNALVSVIKLNEKMKEALASASLPDSMPSISCYLTEKETLQEIRSVMCSAVMDALGSENNDEPVNHYLVDAVMDYISRHYRDQALSLTSIAAEMKTPSRRLSKLVKEAKGISVNDCINEARLAKAAELLVMTDLPIHEIVKQVGVPSETYFFSLFKKHFGASPKEYAHQQKSMLMKRNP